MASHPLRSVYLFKEFSDPDLEALEAVATPQTFDADTILFQEGQPAVSLYVIKYGSVQISQSGADDTVMLATLGTGAHFGEMAFIDGEKRSATARVMERSEIVVIDFARLRALLDAQPALGAKFYRAVAGYLCGRLRATSNELSFMRSRAMRQL